MKLYCASVTHDKRRTIIITMAENQTDAEQHVLNYAALIGLDDARCLYIKDVPNTAVVTGDNVGVHWSDDMPNVPANWTLENCERKHSSDRAVFSLCT